MAEARAAREEPGLKAIEVVAPILNRLPSVLGGFAIAHLGVNADVGCSNVPGLREPAYLAGGPTVLNNSLPDNARVR